jgi:ferredoxin-NADP reductase
LGHDRTFSTEAEEQLMETTRHSLTLRVRRMTWEADGVVSVVLGRADRQELPPFSCGAHVDVVLQPDLIRQYSLCGDRSARREWTIAVLLEPHGRGGSAYVHNVLRPGMEVATSLPRNNFPLIEAENYLFIAGGIGITPILPMVREVADLGRDWALLYGGRRRASMAFLDDMGDLQAHLTVAPQDECGLLDLKAAIEPLPTDTAVYCCGPEPLIAAVEDTCAQLGRDEPHVERFAARENPMTPADAVDGPFEVVLAESGRRIQVPAGKTIIEVLQQAGVTVPTSCEEGFCGTCETDVVDGVPDHRDGYLTDAERAANKTMMVCVGRSKTPVLSLRI